jgi:hypothetical protein
MAEKPRLKAPRLNNMTLGFARRTIEYEAVMTDMVLMGAIPKEVCEAFTGIKFADYLKPPEGYVPPEGFAPPEQE